MSNTPDEELGGGIWYVLVCLAGIVAAVVAGSLLHETRADTWRTAGGLLEVFGIGLGGWSLYRRLVSADVVTPISERLRQSAVAAQRWLRSKLNLESPRDPVILHGTQTVDRMNGPGGRLSVRPRDDAEIREWIEYLDKEVVALRERVESMTRSHGESISTLRERLRETRRHLTQVDRNTKDLIERLTVGGFQWEAVSLTWFFLGGVASTWGRLLPFP